MSYQLPKIIRQPALKIIFYYLILGLIIYIPFEDFIEKWLPTGILFDIARYGSEIIIIALLIITFAQNILITGRIFKTPIDLPFLALIMVGLLSASINRSPIQVTLLGLRPILRYALLFYVLSQAPFPSHFYQRLIKIMILSAFLVAFIGILQTVVGMPLTNFLIPRDVTVGETTVRAGLRQVVVARTYIFSTMGRYDTLGTFLTIFLLLSVSIYLYSTGKLKRFSLAVILIGIPTLALTFSRQSWVATIIGLFIIVLFGQGAKLSLLRFLVLIAG